MPYFFLADGPAAFHCINMMRLSGRSTGTDLIRRDGHLVEQLADSGVYTGPSLLSDAGWSGETTTAGARSTALTPETETRRSYKDGGR